MTTTEQEEAKRRLLELLPPGSWIGSRVYYVGKTHARTGRPGIKLTSFYLAHQGMVVCLDRLISCLLGISYEAREGVPFGLVLHEDIRDMAEIQKGIIMSLSLALYGEKYSFELSPL